MKITKTDQPSDSFIFTYSVACAFTGFISIFEIKHKAHRNRRMYEKLSDVQGFSLSKYHSFISNAKLKQIVDFDLVLHTQIRTIDFFIGPSTL